MRYSQLDYFTVSETKIDKSFPSVQYLLGYFEIRARQGVSRKIKTDDVFSKLRNYTSVYERLPPVGDKKDVFATTRKRLEKKHHPGKEIFQSMILYNTHKSQWRNAFFFVYRKLD